ncbi:MAG: 4-hydroxy-tetrahydrodipicolinate reductase [bacterium]|nr:4-hydroxy-tetrahydrodipicolinate reductase [bacterium]
MVRVIVSGAPGKMGQRVVALLQTDPEFELVGALVHRDHDALGRDVGEIAGGRPLGVVVTHEIEPLLPGADVIIDFSIAAATLTYIPKIAAYGKAMVIGTTGFTKPQQEEIARYSAGMRCFVAPNMSLGINVLFQVLRQVATALGGDYDVEIIEAHHRTKVDAPSGTALQAAAIIADALGRDLAEVVVYGRQGAVGKRSDTEIGIQSIRAGDIVGEHTVIFGGPGERLEFVHRSQSRDNFARGALRAAKWVCQQSAGLYSMEDLLR